MNSHSIRHQFAETLLNIGQNDPNLTVLVGDISHFLLQSFAKACSGRYFNVGICEPTMVGMAAGMAKVGFHPVIHTIAPFLIERAFEQIKLDFCYQQLSGNIVTVGSAFDYANLGCTHHCYGDFALLKTLPNVEITYPASNVEFDSLFRQAYSNTRMTYFRMPGQSHSQEFLEEDIVIGKGIRICSGTDLTLVATGPQLESALQAKEWLSDDGWSVEVLYIHTIRPLDKELICESASKTGKVVVIEEHMRSGGLGDDVLRALGGSRQIHFSSLAIPDQYVTGYGSYADHCAQLGLTGEGIFEHVIKEFGDNYILKKNRRVACL